MVASVGDGLLLSHSADATGPVLSWPAWEEDTILERSSVFQPALEWRLVPRNEYARTSTNLIYRVPRAEGNQFFRVRRLGDPILDLSGYWTLDEGAGPVAADLNGLRLSTTNISWAVGRFGGHSLHFNGLAVNGGGSLAWFNNTNFQTLPEPGRPFSIALWFKAHDLAVGSKPILGTDSDGLRGWAIMLNTLGPGTNELVLSGQSAGATSLSITGRTGLLPGQWRHLVLTCESNRAAMYLDSSLVAHGPLSLATGSGPVYFGGVRRHPLAFHGQIDEIRVFTNSLTPEQISMTGYWRFDEAGGAFGSDSSLQRNPASITSSLAWAPGKAGSGLDAAIGQAEIANDNFQVLPGSGGAFSVSAWIQPRDLPVGTCGLFSCAEVGRSGWQATINVENQGQIWIGFTSTNSGGSLGLYAPLALTNGSWTRLDLNYSGGIAAVYVNGRKMASESGAVRGSRAPLRIGSGPRVSNFNGVIDELKIYSRERQDWEIGPIARPVWETALLAKSTNLVLAASVPPGKPLIVSLKDPKPTLGSITWDSRSPSITYHAGPQKGPDSFVYTVSDGEFISAPATGRVSVVQPHWLSPSGGSEVPLDGSAPERSWAAGAAKALDEIWRTNRYYDCFFYAPGEYQTTGWRYLQRSTANPGCQHIGAGSSDPAPSILKLVGTWSAWEEGVIFSPLHSYVYVDDFEVHNMVLDCNASNNPKYALGEPVGLRVPLISTGFVESVTLLWGDNSVSNRYPGLLGPPAEFEVCMRLPGTNGFNTNCYSVVGASDLQVVQTGTLSSELMLNLTNRGRNVAFYSIKELTVAGAKVSLPEAKRSDGNESRVDSQHSILMASDQRPSTFWASGPEEQVQVTLPLERDTLLNQLEFDWHCATLSDRRRTGPAAQFTVAMRDQDTGQLRDVPFFRTAREQSGRQLVVFGDGQVTNTIRTDQVVILLSARELGVDLYGLAEIRLRHRSATVALRIPSATSTLVWNANDSVLNAFDGDPATAWASGTQGQVSAIDVRGSNLKFTGLKVVGFGTKTARECFPIYVGPPGSSRSVPAMQNILVEDCVVTEPAPYSPDGLSAIVVASPGSRSVINAVIRRCAVLSVASHFTYSHAFAAPLIENCRVEDCQVAIYYEPTTGQDGFESVGSVIVRSNVFDQVVRGISVDFHPGARFESLVCIGNEIVLSGREPRGYGVGICDVCQVGPPGTLLNLTLLHNIVRYPAWDQRIAAPEVGLAFGNMEHAVYANNVVALGTGSPLRVRPYPAGLIPPQNPSENCDHPGLGETGPATIPPSLDILPPGYRRAWYNNRDLNGRLLPVRFMLSGVDGLASQQQWPE